MIKKYRVTFLLSILMFLPSGAQAVAPNIAVMCQALLAASPDNLEHVIFETYRSVLFDTGSELLTIADIENMIATKDYFGIDETGSSARDHIGEALKQIREILDHGVEAKGPLLEKIDLLLRTELSEMLGRKQSIDRQRKARRIFSGLVPSTDWMRTLGENQPDEHYEYSGFSEDQSVFFKFARLDKGPGDLRKAYRLRAWSTENGQEIKRAELAHVTVGILTFAVSKDRRNIAIYSVPDNFQAPTSGGVQVIDLNGFLVKPRLRSYESYDYGQLWFSEDGKRLFQFVHTGRVSEFDLKTGAVTEISNLPNTVLSALTPFSFAPRGGTHVAAKYQGTRSGVVKTYSLHIVDPIKGEVSETELARTYDGTGGAVIYFSEDGKTFLLSGSANGNITVWNTAPTTLRGYLTRKDGKTRATGIRPFLSPNGEFIVEGNSVYSGANGHWLFDLKSCAEAATFSSDGKWLATSPAEKVKDLQIYDLRDGSLKARHPIDERGLVSAIHFAPDGLSLAFRGAQAWHVIDLGGEK